MKKFFFDMDGVLAKYNDKADETDMAKKGYFRNLEAQRNLIDALELLLENGERYGIAVCVLTKVYPSLFPYSVREKLEWRDEFLPALFDSEFVMVNGEECEKSELIARMLGAGINKDYFLIDDYNANLAEWREAGGTAVKFVNGINDKNRSFVGNRLSHLMSAEELYYAILEMAGVMKPSPVATAA